MASARPYLRKLLGMDEATFEREIVRPSRGPAIALFVAMLLVPAAFVALAVLR